MFIPNVNDKDEFVQLNDFEGLAGLRDVEPAGVRVGR